MEEVPRQANEANVRTRVRRDRQHVLVDAAVVERIKKRRKEGVVELDDDEEENQNDHTLSQYNKDDEENQTGHRVPGFGIHEDDE